MQDELMRGNVTVASIDPDESAKKRVRIGPPRATDRTAEILVQKSGEQIHSIVVTCPCGEKITIVCDYAQ